MRCCSHYKKYNVNVNVKFIVFMLLYKTAGLDLGLYLNGWSVYGCKLMPQPPISPMDPERTDCHDQKARL
jgi:hypothetical protein